MYFKKEKNCYFEWYQKLVYAGPKQFDKLKPEPGPVRNARPVLQLCAGFSILFVCRSF